MVKGVSKQVIVVHSPDPKLFEQAIFILKEDAKGVTDEELLREANRALHRPAKGSKWQPLWQFGPAWACAGAVVTGAVWLLTAVL